MRILIIEDEVKVANSLKTILEAESYAVDTCNDGSDGLEMALIEDYDLIILDLGLPGLDGLEISQNIRADKKTVPIIMLTARDAIESKIVGLDSGADDYIVKPFETEELLARIRALLRRGQSNNELTYQVEDLRLNPSSHIVKRGDKELTLSAKEYALLEFLMRHHGQIMTKQQIIDHVWDIDTDPFSNVVDVYIGYLRNKIDKDFSGHSNLITTIKGLGYRIGAK